MASPLPASSFSHLRPALAAVGTLLLVAACGPAGIAVGLSSAGGGGGGVSTPAVSLIGTEIQPADNRTQVSFSLDRPARITVTYAVEGVTSETSVGADSLLDGQGNTLVPVAILDNGQRAWSLPAGASTLTWLHAQDLGREEERGVSLNLGIANTGADSGGAFDRRFLLQNARIGRANGVLAIDSITPTANEGEVVLQTTHNDRGGDLDITYFDVAWRVTGSQGNSGWTALTRDPLQRYPEGVVAVESSPTTPVAGQDVTTKIALTVDALSPSPAGLGIERMAYQNLEFRVTWREQHSPALGFGTATLADVQVEGGAGAVALGTPPTFVLTPEIPSEAGFLVPIKLLVENTSKFASTVTFNGDFTFDDGSPNSQGGPMTLVRADHIVLDPGESRVHFIVWNALADVGLGLIPSVQNVQVGVVVTATLEATGLGDALTTVSDPSAGRPIATEPFVSFDTPLITEGADRLVLQRDEATGAQQLFVQSFPTPTSAFSSQISVDQQFAPIQTTGLQPFDAGAFSGGILQVIPGNFAAEPNCVAFISSGGQIRYLEFSEDLGNGQIGPRGGGINVPVTGNYSPESTSPDQPPATFELGNTKGAVVFNYALTPTETQTQLFFLMANGSGDPVGDATLPRVSRPIWPAYYTASIAERNWRYQTYVVDGEFDLDPATKTVILADKSCNHGSGTATPFGFLDVLEIRMVGGVPSATLGARITSNGIALPPTTPVYITKFNITKWTDPDDPTALPGLILSREFFNPNTGDMTFQTFTLSRDSTGAWAPAWTRLTQTEDLASVLNFNQYTAGRLIVTDLDRDGVNDPLQAVTGRDYIARFASGNGFGDFRLSNTTFRYTLSTTYDQANVEAVLRDVATGGTAYTATLLRNPGNPRIWQDRVGVDPAQFPLEVILRDTTTSAILERATLSEARRGKINFFALANPTNSPRIWRKGFADDLEASAIGVPPAGCVYNSIGLVDLVDVNGDLNLDLVFKLGNCEPIGGGSSRAYDQQIVYYASALAGVARQLETDFGNPIQPSRRPGFLDLNRDGRPDLISRGALYLGDGAGRFQSERAAGFVGGNDAEYWLEQVLPTPTTRLAGTTLDVTAYTNTPGVQKRLAVDTIVLGDALAGRNPERFTGRSVSLALPITTEVFSVRPIVRDPAMVPAQDIAKDLAAVLRPSSGQTRLYRLAYMSTASEFQIVEQLMPDVELVGDLGVARVGDLTGRSDITHNEVVQDLFVAESGNGGRVFWLPVDRGATAYSTNQVLFTARATESVRCIETGLVDGDAYEDLTIVTKETTTGPPIFRVYLLRQQATGNRFASITEADLALRFEVPTSQGAQEPVGWGVDPYRDSMANGVLVSGTEIRVLRPEMGAAGIRLTLVRSPIEVTATTPTLSADTGVVTTDFDLDGIPEVLGGVPGSTIFRVARDNDR